MPCIRDRSLLRMRPPFTIGISSSASPASSSRSTSSAVYPRSQVDSAWGAISLAAAPTRIPPASIITTYVEPLLCLNKHHWL